MPMPPQHLHRVRHHLDAGADAREAAGLLVHLDVEADQTQRDAAVSPPIPAPTTATDRRAVASAIEKIVGLRSGRLQREGSRLGRVDQQRREQPDLTAVPTSRVGIQLALLDRRIELLVGGVDHHPRHL